MKIPSEGVSHFEHLVYHDMGVLISKIIKYEKRILREKRFPKFGCLPKIAMASKGPIAALLASSFL